jgi:uncharacterized protein YqgC (DUF456 family)
VHPLIAQILLPLVSLVGPLLVLLGLPGTWLVLAFAGGFELLTPARLFSNGTMAAVLIVATLGEVWEFLSGSVRARRAGAGRRGAFGAILGGIVGAILGTFLVPAPLVGTLLGGGIGAFALSSALERGGGRPLDEALRIGKAAGIGHALGIVGKFAAAVLVWGVLAFAVWI